MILPGTAFSRRGDAAGLHKSRLFRAIWRVLARMRARSYRSSGKSAKTGFSRFFQEILNSKPIFFQDFSFFGLILFIFDLY